jgi:hypothetical protein
MYDSPLKKSVKKINEYRRSLFHPDGKEKLFDPDLESVEFQALKFTEFLIGRVLFFWTDIH